jgi:hypothetical protein
VKKTRWRKQWKLPEELRHTRQKGLGQVRVKLERHALLYPVPGAGLGQAGVPDRLGLNGPDRYAMGRSSTRPALGRHGPLCNYCFSNFLLFSFVFSCRPD